jgi:ubiquinone/menaquinone biosynthesis C-methylase UbiE
MRPEFERWEDYTKDTDLQAMLQAFERPARFQTELERLIEELCEGRPCPAICEAGSSWGLTSALLPRAFQKTLLDISPDALSKARLFYEHMGFEVKCVQADILALPSGTAEYDLLFSAGLLEHFDHGARTQILAAMYRLVKPGGYLLAAVPNHMSLPYRTGYLLSVARGTWAYQKELKIRNLKKETSQLRNLTFVGERNLDRETVYAYLPAALVKTFRFLDGFCNFQAYLKTFIYRKAQVLG